MAIKQWFIGMCLLSSMMCGCGHVATEQSGSAVQPATQNTEKTDTQTEEEMTLPLEGVTICLDAGHGITEAHAQERISPLSQQTKPAYVSGASGEHQTEEQLNLAVAKYTQMELEQLGASVILTRDTHEATVSNIERAEIANDANVDLCIRIHADGSESASPHGVSVLIPAGELLSTPEIITPSTQAAEIILQEVVAQTGAQNRGLVQREDLTGFNWSQVPCILIEMGFLSNSEEESLLATEEYRQKIAMGIASGVYHWVLDAK